MFITFYSYKGGVGRTLALANVAYLFANEKQEPCNILLWDFDLEAPGLQQIFKVKWGKKRQGFIDLVYKYLIEAKLPNVNEYIYQTDIHNIYILPAGHINKNYSRTLEKINWMEIYNKARGYDFIQNLKTQIEKSQYDYILIDSRTGYSDVGNICVNQLPDSVVLFFRLNNQNIDGTKEVYNIIRKANEKRDKKITIIPVMSPFWPFFEDSAEANKQVEKAHSLFQNLDLLTINFDSVLTYQEKIVCKNIENLKIKIIPKIYEDYKVLSSKIRSNNPDDPLTLSQQARRKRLDKEFEEAFTLYQRLVELRPSNEDYWRRLLDTAILDRNKRTELCNKLESFISTLLNKDSKNHLAIFTRAELRSFPALSKEDAKSILQDYNTSIELQPNYTIGLIGRAKFYANKLKEFDEAIADLNRVISKDPNNFQAYYLRGQVYMYKKEYGNAVNDFSTLERLDPGNPYIYLQISRARFLAKKYNEAKDSIVQYLKIRKLDSAAIIVYSHIMAALGDKPASLSIFEARDIIISPSDRIEIYLINFELDKALEYIDKMMKRSEMMPKRDKIVINFLRLCILILKNQDISNLMQQFDNMIDTEKEILSSLGWSFEELKISLSNSVDKKLIRDEQKYKIEELIKKIEVS